MRLHGINRDVWDRFNSDKPSWEYDVVEAGYKYNMPDLSAAVGLGQLDQAALFRDERQKAVEWYYEELKVVAMLDLPICHGNLEDHSWHLFIIVLNESAKITRNQFIEKLAGFGIGTSVHYKPLNQFTLFKKMAKSYDKLEISNMLYDEILSLPMYPTIQKSDQNYVIKNIKNGII